MHIVLFEDDKWKEFLPLVFTRPVGELRIGILKISEKWSQLLTAEVEHISRPYLKQIYREVKVDKGLVINARLIPDPDVLKAIQSLKSQQALIHNETLLAIRFDKLANISEHLKDGAKSLDKLSYSGQPFLLEKITDIFTKNAKAIALDFELLTKSVKTAELHHSNKLIGPESSLFIESNAKVHASIFNTSDGPIYIGKNAEVMEGSMIRGPFALGEGSHLKMGAKIYGATTIGPGCKVGGEVSNSVFMEFSNKAHDGFIGNSVIGAWCNLGADTNNSNLKNNYSDVDVFNYATNKMKNTGLTFCGLVMADHSKCGINTMFNTGTVVGVSANIFGGSFLPKHIPSFAWGGSDGFVEYDLNKAIETAQRVLARRSMAMTNELQAMLTEVFKLTAEQRFNLPEL